MGVQPQSNRPSHARSGLRQWAMCVTALGVAALVIALGALAVTIVRYGATDRARPADVIIVLGGGDVGTARRAEHAAALYHAGYAPHVLCTGGYSAAGADIEAGAAPRSCGPRTSRRRPSPWSGAAAAPPRTPARQRRSWLRTAGAMPCWSATTFTCGERAGCSTGRACACTPARPSTSGPLAYRAGLRRAARIAAWGWGEVPPCSAIEWRRPARQRGRNRRQSRYVETPGRRR